MIFFLAEKGIKLMKNISTFILAIKIYNGFEIDYNFLSTT